MQFAAYEAGKNIVDMTMKAASVVGLRCAQFQVLWAVIQRISISMVNDFINTQWPTYKGFHDNSVAIEIFLAIPDKGTTSDRNLMIFCEPLAWFCGSPAAAFAQHG